MTDGRGAATTGRVQVVVAPVNDPPIASNSTSAITGDTPGATLLPQGFDADDDQFIVQMISLPLHGLINPGTLTYRPLHGFVGNDTVTFILRDAKTNSNVATLTINVRAPLDADNDRIPDYWETLYDINNPADDRDADGHSNYQAYLANTDPRDPLSVFRVVSLQPTPDRHWTVTWRSSGGTRYRVQYSDGQPDRGFTGSFADVILPIELEMDPNPDGVPGLMSFTDDSLPPATGPAFSGSRS